MDYSHLTAGPQSGMGTDKAEPDGRYTAEHENIGLHLEPDPSEIWNLGRAQLRSEYNYDSTEHPCTLQNVWARSLYNQREQEDGYFNFGHRPRQRWRRWDSGRLRQYKAQPLEPPYPAPRRFQRNPRWEH